MYTITIVGLGPGDFDDLTVGALRALQSTSHLLLRTSRHPCIEALLPMLDPSCSVQSCDDLYEQHAEFAEVYAAIVGVLDAAQQGNVVYAVPGHPWVGEATTPLLLQQEGSRR